MPHLSAGDAQRAGITGGLESSADFGFHRRAENVAADFGEDLDDPVVTGDSEGSILTPPREL